MVIVMAEGRERVEDEQQEREKDSMIILTLCMRAMHDTCGKRVVHQK